MSNNECPNNNTIIAQKVFDPEDPSSLGILPDDVYNFMGSMNKEFQPPQDIPNTATTPEKKLNQFDAFINDSAIDAALGYDPLQHGRPVDYRPSQQHQGVGPDSMVGTGSNP